MKCLVLLFLSLLLMSCSSKMNIEKNEVAKKMIYPALGNEYGKVLKIECVFTPSMVLTESKPINDYPTIEIKKIDDIELKNSIYMKIKWENVESKFAIEESTSCAKLLLMYGYEVPGYRGNANDPSYYIERLGMTQRQDIPFKLQNYFIVQSVPGYMPFDSKELTEKYAKRYQAAPGK